MLGERTYVRSTSKPAQTVARATAVVDATDATYDEVLDAGLTALGETRASLFGYGIENVRRGTTGTLTGAYVVVAHRD